MTVDKNIANQTKRRNTKREKYIFYGVIAASLILLSIFFACVYSNLTSYISLLDNISATPPTSWSPFHIAFFIPAILLTIPLPLLCRRVSDTMYRTILFIFFFVLVCFEINKQFVALYHIDSSGHLTIGYQWYAFPFAFCSMPYYMLPLIIFLPKGKIRRAVETFSAIFITLGGLVVMLYPNTILAPNIYLCIQSMIHHSLMIIFGIYIAIYNRPILNLRNFFGASVVFAIVLLIAVALNETVHVFMPNVYFNAFSISRFYDIQLPILTDIQKAAPYPVFVLSYFAALEVGAYLILIIYSLLINRAIKPCLAIKKQVA